MRQLSGEGSIDDSVVETLYTTTVLLPEHAMSLQILKRGGMSVATK